VIDRMTCRRAQERMSVLLAGALDGRERLEVEAHASRCARCGMAYRDLVFASVALDRAYAPLRAAGVAMSPARVRLALRIPQPVPTSLRLSRLTARVTEVALAAAVTAFAFVGSASVAPKAAIVDEAAPDLGTLTHVSADMDDQYFLRWLRIGRYAAPADLVDPAVTPRSELDDSPVAPTRGRGLVR
jgi:anti-sigma factor RsiW